MDARRARVSTSSPPASSSSSPRPSSPVPSSPRGGEERLSDPHAAKSSELESIFNLSNTIVGAGVMALPKVVAELGIFLSTLMIVGSAAVSIFCIDIVVWASQVTHQHGPLPLLFVHCSYIHTHIPP